MSTPLVSVIIPTYNRARSLAEAIESVRAQTYPHWELLIIDDGSSDTTSEVIARYAARDARITGSRQPRVGPSGARNAALRIARGELIAFLDDDDLWLPEKLARQVEQFVLDPSLGLLYARCDVQRDGVPVATWPERPARDTFDQLFDYDFIPTLTVMVQRKCLDQVGGFEPRLPVSHDYELWLRLARRYPFRHLWEVLAIYRLHQGNVSSDLMQRCRDHIWIFRRMLRDRPAGYSSRRVVQQFAKTYGHFARLLEQQGAYQKAAWLHVKGILTDPLIGLLFWDPETEGMRWSAPYRLFKPYGTVMKCALRGMADASTVQRTREQAKTFLQAAVSFFRYLVQLLKRHPRSNDRAGVVTYEFFHEELGGFGGYGMTVKNITSYCNTTANAATLDVLMTKKQPRSNAIRHVHDADVLFQWQERGGVVRNTLDRLRYGALLDQRRLGLLLTIEYYQSYESILMALPRTPVVIWIKDPRPPEDWEQIATVALELKTENMLQPDACAAYTERIRTSLHRLLDAARWSGRPVRFVHQAACLVPKARVLYALPSLSSTALRNPIHAPPILVQKSPRPRVCWIGRLEPIKRPWIFWELAKRFPQVEFCVAGMARYPAVMDPIMQRYQGVPNLTFLGLVEGAQKDALLQSSWALVNTSIHEALPVTYLEAFAAATPVVACQDPDGLAQRFGRYTGELLGEGLDEQSLGRFEDALRGLLAHEDERYSKGAAAKRYVEEVHSFARFEQTIKGMLEPGQMSGAAEPVRTQISADLAADGELFKTTGVSS